MLTYRDHEIPETYDEIKATIKSFRIPGVMLPTLLYEYKFDNGDIININTSLTLEGFYEAENDDLKKEVLVRSYITIVKECIDGIIDKR